MARYIDVEKVNLKGIAVFDENLDLLIPLSDVRKALQMTPTADVVPKSEVDKWKEINEQLHKEMSEQIIEERKIERKLAVVQIIGEILSNHTPDVDGFLMIHKSELAELKKKHTGNPMPEPPKME